MRLPFAALLLLIADASATSERTSESSSFPPRSDQLDSSYTFDLFAKHFGRTYERGSDEWGRRERIFNRNLDTILEHNSRFYGSDGAGADDGDGEERTVEGKRRKKPGHTLGINHLADLDPSELPLGYDKGRHPSWQNGRSPLLEPLSEAKAETAAASRTLQGGGSGKHRQPLPFSNDPISSLPSQIDWRNHGVVTPVKDQGGCGSCWAFASAAVLESHVALQTGTLFEFSPQEFVSCVPNPHHCGGAGGCSGSTAEIALDFVAGDGGGVVQEYQFGYESYHGKEVECSIMKDGPAALRGGESGERTTTAAGIEGAVATVDGYANVPTNDYATLMNAIAKTGPVAVAVAASTWALYEGGVFSVDMAEGGKNTDLNHAVVLVGYGTDEETGEDYWLVRNSWRPTWGEGGYIRLKRVDPAATSPDDGSANDNDKDCGMDTTPLDGMACETDDDGHPIPPKPIEVCGTSGILYDGVVPVGGRRLP